MRLPLISAHLQAITAGSAANGKPVLNVTVFRSAIVCEWLLVVAGLILSDVLQGSLPGQLQEYLEWEYAKDIAPRVWIFLIYMPIYFVAYIVGSVGLLMLKPWAKWLYMVAVIDAYVVPAFLPYPVVEHAITSLVYDAEAILSGFIIGVAFFSNVLKKRDWSDSQEGFATPQGVPPDSGRKEESTD